ncbi:MAG: LysE family translocator [Pseudomonadota bacterium]
MEIHIWLSFVAASAVIIAMPGPTVLYLMGQTATYGIKQTLKLAPVVAFGVLCSITASLAGAGGLLLASTTLFNLLKVIGAIYLIWLGFRTIRQGTVPEAEKSRKPSRQRFAAAFAISALNPKVLVFYIAFLPQFVRPSEPLMLQFSILAATFTALAFINAGLWIVVVGKLKDRMAFRGATQWLNWIAGGLLVSAGAFTFKSIRNQ